MTETLAGDASLACKTNNTGGRVAIKPVSVKAVRGLPLSTYAQRGRGGVGPNAYVVYRLSQARLREFAYKGGRGVQKAGKSAYVLNGSPLSQRTLSRYYGS